MRARQRFLLLVAFLSTGAWTMARPAPGPQAIRLVVQNETYSSLVIGMEESGRETVLGQAPPDFTNTLVIRSEPAGQVQFTARLAGERDVLYRSTPVQLTAGRQVRWRLPDNVLE